MKDDPCDSPGLISVDDAIKKILDQALPVTETESIEILDALGRFLASDLMSSINVPGYDNSAMDGYAVRSADCSEEGISMEVSQRIPAGTVGFPLKEKTAARIFTGAPIPPGADAVVMQEQCSREGETVRINAEVAIGQNIRRAGEDIASGSIILEQGKQLRPQELGLIASVGIHQIPVYRKLRVATFFTGDELVTPGKELADGQIYNSNRYTLRGLLQANHCDVTDLGIVPDTLEDTRKVLQQASENADIVITSGGVSVGEEDYVRIALEELGELSMWRIAMKPGKPVAFGKVNDALFMGLPGNPVSVFVTFLLFARPLILRMQGLENTKPEVQYLTAGFNYSAGKRQEYLRARIEQDLTGAVVKLFPHQGSGVLSSASWAEGLVEIKVGESVKQGDKVKYISFKELLN